MNEKILTILDRYVTEQIEKKFVKKINEVVHISFRVVKDLV
jgi:hypothetical protein